MKTKSWLATTLIALCAWASGLHSLRAEEIIIDNPAAQFYGSWMFGTNAAGKYGTNYGWSSTVSGGATASAVYRPSITSAGKYDVYVWYAEGSNRASNAPWTVSCASGTRTVSVNQQINGSTWVLISQTNDFAAGTGGYVQLANNCTTGAVVVADAVKLVSASPVITSQPQDQIAVEWYSATFSVSATSPRPLSYQWKFNGNNIDGATSTTLTINGVHAEQTGTYTVVVSDGVLSVTSQPALLQLGYALETFSMPGGSVLRSPNQQNYLPNTVVTLTASPAAGYAFNAWSEDAQGTNTVVTVTMTRNKYVTASFIGLASGIIIDNPQSAKAGSWSTGSTAADKYATNYDYAGTVVSGATAWATYTPNLAAGRYNVYIWYPQGSNRSSAAQWQVSYDGGSITVPVNQRINGGAWRLLASSKDFATGTSGFVRLYNNTGMTNEVVVADAVKFVSAEPAVIVAHPQHQIAFPGQSATFTVVAAGAGPISYQWKRNGTALSGATSSTLTLANLQQTNTANYSVVVSNAFGWTESVWAALSVVGTFTNGNFEAGLNGWNYNEQAHLRTPALQGTYCAGFSIAGEVWQAVSVYPGATYSLRYDKATCGEETYMCGVGAEVRAGETALPLTGYYANVYGPAGFEDHVRAFMEFTVPEGVTAVTIKFFDGSPESAPCWTVMDDVHLDLVTPVTITSQPQSQTVNQGQAVNLSVTALGVDPLTYQWKFNGTPISGATGSTLTLANAQSIQSGNYTVAVGDCYGSTESQWAEVTVIGTFTNGNFEQGIAGWNYNYQAGVRTPGLEGNYCAVFSIAGEVWQTFSVYPGATYTIWYDTAGCGDETYMCPIWAELKAGDTAIPMTGYDYPISGPAGFSDHVRSYRSFTVPAGVTAVTFRFIDGSPESAPCWTVADSVGLQLVTPVTITSEPQSQTVNQGQTISLSVTAIGAEPLTYQWKFDGTPISGATASTLTLPNAQTLQSGNYSVVVGCPNGSTESQWAEVAVVGPFRNGNFEQGLAGWNYNYQTSLGTPAPQGTYCAHFSIAGEVWQTFSVYPGATYSLRYDILGCGEETYMCPAWGEVRAGETLLPLTGYTTSVYGTPGFPDHSRAFMQFTVPAGVTAVTVRFIDGSPESAPCWTAVDDVQVQLLTPVTITSQPQSQTVNQGQTVNLSVTALGVNPMTYQWKFNGTAISGATSSTLALVNAQSIQSGNYSVVVGDCYGSTESQWAEVTVIGTFTNGNFEQGLAGWNYNYQAWLGSPALQGNYCAGFSIAGEVWQTFSVYPGATYTLWYDTAGCGSETYMCPIWAELKAGDTAVPMTGYDYPISGPAGFSDHVRSYRSFTVPVGVTALTLRFIDGSPESAPCWTVADAVGLQLVTPVTITSQPQSQTVNQGETISLSVTAIGANPLTYQWKFDGTPISGATASTLTLANAQTLQTGNYSVVVGSPNGSTESQWAEVTVIGAFRNGGFEQGLAGWNYNYQTWLATPGMEGNYAASFSIAGEAWQTFSVVPGATYSLQFDTAICGSETYICGIGAELRAGETVLPMTGYNVPRVGPPGFEDSVRCFREFVVPMDVTAVTLRFIDGSPESAPCWSAFDAVSLQMLTAITITSQPEDQTVDQGDNVTLSVGAIGVGPLTYQWKANGVAIPGATTSSLTIVNAQSIDTGNYTVAITNAYGWNVSQPALVSVVGPFVNGGFESGLAGWNYNEQAVLYTPGLEGNYCAGMSIAAQIWKDFTVIPGRTYSLQYDWATCGDSHMCVLYSEVKAGNTVLQMTGSEVPINDQCGFADHVRVSRQFTVPAGVSVIRLTFYDGSPEDAGCMPVLDRVILE